MSHHRKLLTVLLLLLLLACRQESREEGQVTLTFWHSFVASTLPALQQLIADFEGSHPGIRIKAQYIPTGDALSQKLITAIQTRTAPDISWIHADFIQYLVEADAIYPMRHFIDREDGLSAADMADFFPPLLAAAEWRRTLYALPMEATCLALLYNRDLFRQAGLDPQHPPATWEELYDYTLKLTRDRDGDGKTDQYGFYVPVFAASGPLSIWMVLQWTPFLWQAGGSFINPEQTQVLFNQESGVQALAFWKKLYDAMQFKTFSTAHDLAFFSGSLAMVMDGPWNLPRYRQLRGVDWAVAPLPAGPAASATYLAGEEIAIFKQSAHPDAAWLFVKWITSPEVQARFSIQSGYLPVRQSVLQMPAYQAHLAADAPLRAFVEQMPRGRAREEIDFHRLEINQTIAEAVEQCLAGGRDPRTALDQAALRANNLLQQAP